VANVRRGSQDEVNVVDPAYDDGTLSEADVVRIFRERLAGQR